MEHQSVFWSADVGAGHALNDIWRTHVIYRLLAV